MEKLPHLRYANLYGPTETNVCAYHEVNLFRRNKRRRSRSAKLAQILTSFRSTQKGNESPRLTRKAFFARGDPPLCKVIRPP
jgi:hypothetical protein